MSTPTRETTPTEFGSGLIVCLVKFTEHLRDERAESVYRLDHWMRMTPQEQQQRRNEAARAPMGDAATFMMSIAFWIRPMAYGDTLEDRMHRLIEMWMNAASDHFYDLNRERAPAALCELADLALTMGHGFRQSPHWTMADVERLRELWQQSCLELDKLLGVECDWGNY